MSFSRRLAQMRKAQRSAVMASIATLVLLLATSPAMALTAVPAAGLCVMNTARGAVPADFPLDACVDGSAIWVRNQLDVPVRIAVSGDTGHAVNVLSDAGLAAITVRALHPDPLLVLPGDTVRISVGSSTASAATATTDIGGDYLIASIMSTFTPGGKVKSFYEAFTGLVKDFSSGYATYRSCLAGANWIAQIGCRTRLAADLTFAFGKAVVLGLAKAVLAVLLDVAFFAKYVAAQVPDLRKILFSKSIIRVAALAPGPASHTSPPPVVIQPTPAQTQPQPQPPAQVVAGLHYNCVNDNSNIGKYVPSGKYWQNGFTVNGSTITGGFAAIGANDDGGNHNARVGIYSGLGIGNPISTVVVAVRGYGGQNFTLPAPITVTRGQTLYLTVIGIGDFTAYDNRSGCFIGRVDGLP